MFDDFSSVHDPLGIHQWGEIDVQGEKVRFTIVCKDLAGTGISLDAADPSVTVWTIQVCLLDELEECRPPYEDGFLISCPVWFFIFTVKIILPNLIF